jgi:hypothetical protein
VFLLAVLRIECPHCPNTDYMAKLKDFYNRDISVSAVLICRYEYAGTYRVPNLVPIDKWMMQNATRVMAYHAIMKVELLG